VAPELVSVQYAQGGGADADRFNTYVDATGFLPDDFLVIGLMSPAGGGGYNWFNSFSSAPSTPVNHVTGPFGDVGDVFGHLDAGMVNGGFASSLLRHKVTAGDLVDTAGGTGTLNRIGFARSSASGPYGTNFICWQMRGVTYSSKTSAGDSDFAPVSPDPHTLSLALSQLTDHQAFFSMGVSHGNGYTPPATFIHSASDNGVTGFNPHVFTRLDWTYAFSAANNGMQACANHAFGTFPDASAFAVTLGVGGDTGGNADACAAIVTFAESVAPPVQMPNDGTAGLYLPETKLDLKLFPNRLNDGTLDGVK
jgi:hypothetical protein